MGVSSSIVAMLMTLSTVFAAEIGDKTMIATATLVAKTRKFLPVFFVSIMGFALANAIVVAVGVFARSTLNIDFLKLIAAILFVIMGTWMIINREENKEESKIGLLAIFVTVFISEIGDKTQLAVFSSTILMNNPIFVLLGGVFGYAMANFVGTSIMKVAGSIVDLRMITRFGAVLFIIIGILMLLENIGLVNGLL